MNKKHPSRSPAIEAPGTTHRSTCNLDLCHGNWCMHVYVYFCVAPCSLNSTIKTQPWWKPTDHGEGAVMEARSLPIVPSTPTFACRLPNLRFQRPCALVSVVHHRFGERREKGKKSWMYAAVRFACPRQRRLRNFPLKKLARCIRMTLKIPATVRLTPLKVSWWRKREIGSAKSGRVPIRDRYHPQQEAAVVFHLVCCLGG